MTSEFVAPRINRLRAWMVEHDISNQALAEKLGLTGQRVSQILRQETMPIGQHTICVELGFPVELLPVAVKYLNGRKPRVPVWPGLQNEAEAQQA